MKFHSLQESGGGSGSYLKIGDGDSAVIIPRGEIFGFKIKWEGGKSTEIPESNPARHNRFKINVVIKDEKGNAVAKVWEFGIMIYNTLAAFASEMSLTETKIKVSRKGIGTDTIYTLIPLGQLNATESRQVEAVKLNILASKAPMPSRKAKDEYPIEAPPDWVTEDIDSEELPF